MSEEYSAKMRVTAPGRPVNRSVLWVVLSALLLILPLQGVAYAADLEGEAKLKAKYILNFAKLVEWPVDKDDASNDRFLIGICGDPYLWRACRRELAGKKIAGRRVALSPLSLEKAAGPAAEMKILYVASDDEEELKAIIAALADRPILLISDHPDFSQWGGSIGLVRDKDRMLFEVNRRQEARTGFKINSRLLRVARSVLE